MFKTLMTKVFGDRHEREAKKLWPVVDEINEIADELQSLSEDALRGQTEKLRGIVRERTADLEAQLAELRERKRHTEDSAEREQLSVEIRSAEDAQEVALRVRET